MNWRFWEKKPEGESTEVTLLRQTIDSLERTIKWQQEHIESLTGQMFAPRMQADVKELTSEELLEQLQDDEAFVAGTITKEEEDGEREEGS